MGFIGYWASQEQYSMHSLIKFVVEGKKGGFTATMTSDHFHPWWHDNGYGNFTWVWLTAAAERTKNMRFVTGVTSPVYRYNPDNCTSFCFVLIYADYILGELVLDLVQVRQ